MIYRRRISSPLVSSAVALGPLSFSTLTKLRSFLSFCCSHNLRDPQTGRPPNLFDPALLDPSLVLRGKTAAVEVGERIRAWWHATQLGESIQLIITSPLTRCIQTAVLAFLPGNDYGSSTPFVCLEGVREAFGSHYPDQRRAKSVLLVRLLLNVSFFVDLHAP
jgi:hypothetical protein